MTCKTCKWLRARLNKNGVRVVRKDGAYPCDYPFRDMPKLPDSVSRGAYHGFKWPPSTNWMTGDAGAACPCHEPYVKATP